MSAINIDEIGKFLDGHGYVCPKPQPPNSHCANGNGNLDTAILLILIGGCAELEEKFNEAIYQSEILPGLILRGPHKYKDQVSRDDYLGLMAYFKIFKKSLYAINVRNRMIQCFGIFNSDDSLRFNDWFIRFPDFMGHVNNASGYKNNAIISYMWSLSMVQIKKPDGTDSLTLNWLKYLIADRDDKIQRQGCLWFLKSIRRYGRLKKLFTERYGENHPITRLAPRRGIKCSKVMHGK